MRTYLGVGQIINTAHPGVTGGLDLTLGTAQNGYSGLDQWGRVVDQIWGNDAGTSVLDEYRYGYDAAGNRLWKQNAGPGATGLDELYSNDALYRLIAAARGTLNSGKTAIATPNTGPLALNQTWNLDGLGNFSQSSTNGATQDRATNASNEIQSMTTGSTTTTPTYDAAGNLTSDGTLKYTYDAWNRQVAVKDESGNVIATYSFDGLGRRITKTLADGTKTDYYYNENWQVLEERTASPLPPGEGQGEGAPVVTQYVWDVSYVDSPVVRFTDTTGDGTFDQTLYYMWDANHNVTGLVNPDGTVAERYVYAPYGQATICHADWSPEYATDTTTPVSASPLGNEILYCGYRYDPETVLSTSTAGATGNYHCGAREYLTTLSTWAAPDPLDYAAGDPNLYRYCGGRSANAVDPSGLDDVPAGFTELTAADKRWIKAHLYSTCTEPLVRQEFPYPWTGQQQTGTPSLGHPNGMSWEQQYKPTGRQFVRKAARFTPGRLSGIVPGPWRHDPVATFWGTIGLALNFAIVRATFTRPTFRTHERLEEWDILYELRCRYAESGDEPYEQNSYAFNKYAYSYTARLHTGAKVVVRGADETGLGYITTDPSTYEEYATDPAGNKYSLGKYNTPTPP